MKFFKSTLYYLLVVAVLVALFSQEVEARRKILRGRKTLTRTYLRDNAIPAWAIICLAGLGEIIVGGILYIVMKKLIVDRAAQSSYAMTGDGDY